MERLYDKSYLELVDSLPVFSEYVFWENLKDRKIILNDDVNESLVEKAIIQIINWNEKDTAIPVELRLPIRIYIYSNGGDVIAGLGLISTVQNSITPVHTICVGLAASMGALLLLSGHHRTIRKNDIVLLHDGSLQVANSSKKAKQTMAFYDQLELRLKNLIVEKTKITPELYDSKNDEEWYIFGDDALELGIVDEVI